MSRCARPLPWRPRCLGAVALTIACGGGGSSDEDSGIGSATLTPGDTTESSSGSPESDSDPSADSSSGGTPSECANQSPADGEVCYVRELVAFDSLSVVLGDFDGDGHLDAAATAELDTALVLFAGDGTGALAPAAPFTFVDDHESFGGDPAVFRGLVAMGETGGADRLFSRANHPDTGEHMLWWSNGGAMALAWFVNIDTQELTSQLGDLDGDGDHDVAVIRAASSGVTASLCDASACAAEATQMLVDDDNQLANAVAQDFDMDGLADLMQVVDTTSGSDVLVWRNLGAGQLDGAATRISLPDNSVEVDAWALADFDGNGTSELVVAAGVDDGVELFVVPRLGDGSFAESGTIIPGSDDLRHLVVVDVEGNGAQELVQVDIAGVSIWRGGGEASLTRFERLLLEPESTLDGSVVSGDLDEDGIVDFVAPVTVGDGTRAMTLLRSGG